MQNYESLLKYFQATANDYGVGREAAEGKFDPIELDVAEKFIDEKLPEIRQLYKVRKFSCKVIIVWNLSRFKIGNKFDTFLANLSRDLKAVMEVLNRVSETDIILRDNYKQIIDIFS